MRRIFKYIKDNAFLSYSLIFILFIIIGFLPIEIKNERFLFSGLFGDRKNGIDGLKQHLLFMYDFVSKIKDGLFSGRIDLYRYDIGLGADFLLSYAYYSLFDPLTIVAYIIPIRYIEFSYYLLILLRLYLSGIFFMILAKNNCVKKTTSLVAISIFYVFNCAVLFSALRHPMFMNGPMILPLVILGVELVLNKKKNGYPLIIVASFLALVTQFYFFVYTSFAFGIYLIFRLWPDIKDKKFKDFFKLIGLYLLGVGLASVVLVPQLLAVLNGARVGDKGFSFYNLLDYATYLSSQILPVVGDKYTAGISNIVVFFICLLVIVKDKKKSYLVNYLLFLLILGLFAFFGFALSGFSYVNNRWTYILILPASLIVGKFLDSEEIIEEADVARTYKIIRSILVFSFTLVIAHFLKILIVIESLRILSQIVVVAIGLLVSYRLNKSNRKYIIFTFKLNNLKLYKAVIYSSFFSLLLMSGIYCFILTPGYVFYDYYEDHDTYRVITDDNSFYRVEQKTYVAGVDNYSNDGIYYGYSSSSHYNTMVNGPIVEFFKEYNINNSNNTVGYNGFDFRTRLLQYNNVKYLIIRDSDKAIVPTGYSFYDKVLVKIYDDNKDIYDVGGKHLVIDGDSVYEYANIYKADYLLNFGVVYPSYVKKNNFLSLLDLERELLLLDAVILEEETILDEYNPDYSLNILKLSDLESNLVEVTKKSSYKRGESVTIKINDIIDSEVFIGLNSINRENIRFSVSYETDDVETVVDNYAYGSNMYLENSNHLVNLGYYESKEELVVTINFLDDYYSDLEITGYLLKSDDIESKVNKLNENSLSDLVFNGRGFAANLNSSINGILNIPLPYSTGFTAYINGEEVEVLKVNTGFMGIYVTSGTSLIEFKYNTPGLNDGLFLSLASLAIITALARCCILKRIEENKVED